MATGLKYTLHGVGLALEAKREDFLAFAHDYLAPLTVEGAGQPLIRVTLHWDRALPPADLEPLGRRVWVGENRLRLTEIRQVPGLQLEVGWDRDGMRVRATYRWPTRRARWLTRLTWAARARLYVSLIYYLVYFPWGWWMERERGWSLIHAAALARGEDGIVLSGLPGCGKSTFVWAALALPGWRLLSDNLLFTDGRQVWACPEPLHVDERARELSSSTPVGVRPAGRSFSHQREDFELAPQRRVGRAYPRGLVFLRRGRRERVEWLEGEVAFRRLWAGDLLAREWMAYQECAAALHHLIPQVGDPLWRWMNLQELTMLPCYEVALGEGGNLAEVARRVLERVNGGGA
ncbi:MAG TPA: hypothetical protein EYH30_04655 [Anaerolineales bacterium]|nr:hypothetical protein [Anaerolineae bacterium]HIQ01405.1 hypothetical protein [Anaerolineales bacterium]